jgi:hypothetical protein
MGTTTAKMKSQVMVTMAMERDMVTRPKIPVTITTKTVKQGDLLTQSVG